MNAVEQLTVMELNELVKAFEKNLAFLLLLLPLQVQLLLVLQLKQKLNLTLSWHLLVIKKWA